MNPIPNQFTQVFAFRDTGQQFVIARGRVRHYSPRMSILELESKALISWPPAGTLRINNF